ncbi:DEAD/DEAH box helicase [Pseudonocardia broussonetiae]|uniref:DEAD/DEAH box helicase n=1 Tax=Pseudonocardia broussonetiae TaxID=2736640 RepID=A0A6M6JRB1_9PSEU|nr:DEAD/DEAH box helicase [Pseudonocardia broussonetiae]QJY49845.1 DEAD/DEAH box helicase [Pseudonocardia broussonetiae]
MLPSLVAEDLRASLTSFLGTTFALGDDDVRAELERFVADPAHGVFRGPYVRLRLPFRPADESWRGHLDWSPAGFRPHRHQAQAWMRLASRNRQPLPTLVTTGTGSGKTESFLVPLLDHCRRNRGQRGIKAIVLYPMNALANDQARRVAGMVHRELSGLRVGLYTGDSTGGDQMTDTAVIGDRYAMRADPPDILLTNYKMLDMLLLRSEDVPLFAGAEESLRYLVLDEFHTYDGAQGTDVAMLLRRLGAALGVTTDDRPLGAITPVATSATLGGGPDGAPALRRFAETVFGLPFDEDALVGEDRLTVDEWAGTDTYGPVPLLDEVTSALRECSSHAEQLAVGRRLFLGSPAANPGRAGELLRAHPLTRTLLGLTAVPRPLGELAADLEPSWGATSGQRAEAGRHAVALFLALLSQARDGDRPLLGVDVQLWIREVSRLLRRLGGVPQFRWHEGAEPEDGSRHLPSVFCRHCGRSGWGVVATAGGGHETGAVAVWGKSVVDPAASRAWIYAPGEAGEGSTDVVWVDPDSADVVPTPTSRHGSEVPVLVTPDAQAARDGQCPSCGRADGIRFLGSRVATLASATLGQLFGSPDIAAAEKKTLVFTDSVQDASHRAAFVESRAYALNLRALLHRAIGHNGCTLDALGAAVADGARTPAERYAVLPPDLREHEVFRAFWADDGKRERYVTDFVARRMAFSATLEFGLASRTGRTSELTGAVTAHVHVEDLAAVVDRALTAVARHDLQLTLDGVGPQRTAAWARGIIERVRVQGGIAHEWLTRFAETDDRHRIWGGRPRREGMPAFPAPRPGQTGRPAPRFPTAARRAENLDLVVGSRSWYSTWTARALGVPAADASRYVLALFDALVADGALVRLPEARNPVWQIPAGRVLLARTSGAPPMLRCTVCATRFPGPEIVLDELDGGPCQRDRCPGVFSVERSGHDYYRELYRGGEVRRIVAREHTSLLPAAERVALEETFKSAKGADAPNVLTCTPTLELGIDIGDLSTVALTSLPRSTASYLQRVGRAGRLTGNALVVSLLPARPLELQRLTDPLTMIAGDVVPPACYLDATEILRRQYLASLFDRHARSPQPGRTRLAKDVFAGGLTSTSWLGRIVADARANAEPYVEGFLRGFGDAVTKDTAAELGVWAGVGAEGVPGFERDVEAAVTAWVAEGAELDERRKAVDAEIARMRALPSLDEAGERDLRRLFGELGAVRSTRAQRDRTYWISALEAAGLLPNYALLDDTTRLDVGLWWTDEESGAHESSDEQYVRGSRTALSELAPGATFYVRGTSVEIDGIDLGTSRNPATVVRRFCPACGWSGPGGSASGCPRCGALGAADAGQVLTTLPFRRASAYASRELAMRDDDTEDRRRTRFTVVTTVDADPDDITAAWELADYPFGAEVLRSADIGWINVGPADRGGATRTIAGQEVATPLFDACTHCGVVPAAQRGVRDRSDARHRGWCRQRREPSTTAWASVALTHRLRTQAVRLLVPPIVVADRTVRTSLRAALLLGLREVLGGDPDHLDVVEAADPVPGSSERWVMVLHDLVPGGTGYLGRFSDPDRVRDLLAAALRVLQACPCRSEAVTACHRCLLPHVAPHLAPEARRDAAVDLLEQILGQWEPRPIDTIRRIVVGSHDTPIEKRFRALLLRWAKTRGAAVTTQATTHGDRATVQFPQAHGSAVWQLSPQVRLGEVQPDFLLTSADTEVPRIAVFCDSVRWHSSPQTNRLADDASKRAGLRDQDVLVWAVTHDDLDAFALVLDGAAVVPPAWCDEAVRTTYGQVARRIAAPGSVPPADLLSDPISMLTAFVLRPERSAWESPAHALALAFVRGAATKQVDDVDGLLWAELTGEPGPGPGRSTVAVPRSARGAVVAAELQSPADVRVWLGVDDRDGRVGTPEQVGSWKDWLALSTALQFLAAGRFHAHTSNTVPRGGAELVVLPLPWQQVVDVSEEVIAALVRALAGTGVPLPEAGFEVDDGEYQLDLAWPAAQIAVVAEPDDGREAWLAGNGWTAVPPDVAAVRAALTPVGGP